MSFYGYISFSDCLPIFTRKAARDDTNCPRYRHSVFDGAMGSEKYQRSVKRESSSRTTPAEFTSGQSPDKSQEGSLPGTSTPKAESRTGLKLPANLQWIPANWTWSKIKPVIRCAVAAWIAAVLFIIPRAEVFMGQVCLEDRLP